MLVTFSQPEALDVALVGGKGYGLAKATQSGLPVPEGVVLTTEAYRAWFTPHIEYVRQLLNQHDSAYEQSQAIVNFLGQQPLPAILETALKKLQRKTPQRYFAVRSSGSAEDMPGAAFAGLHDTLLNVHGVEALIDAVKQCWLSLWNVEVLPYRDRLGVAHESVAMAVVIQQMVDVKSEEAAGVAFSIDPVRGEIESVLINAAFGLGETVVSGEAPVDEYRVNQAGEMTMQHIAMKPQALVRGKIGSELIDLPKDKQDMPAISAEQAMKIAALARQAEKYFDFPQDIEWAIESEQIYLLQSRPVTRFAPRWTRDESAERFPNPITPLTWYLCEAGFHRSLNYSFDLMGLPPFHDKWFSLKDGYVYGNQNAVDIYAGRLPAAPLKDRDSLSQFIEHGGVWQFTWIDDLPTRWMNELDTYLLAIGRFNHIDYGNKNLRECWQILQEMNALGTQYFLPNIAISLTQTLLYRVLRHILTLLLVDENKAQQTFDELIAVTETKTGAVNQAMWQLSRQLRELPALLQQRFHDAETLQQALVDYPEFISEFDAFLALHGHREVDFDAYHPTWLEAPHTVFAQIQIMAHQADNEHKQQYWQKKRTMTTTELSLLQHTPENLRFFLQELIRLVRVYTALDDIEHYQTTRLTIPFRRAAHEIGVRLQNLGALDVASDVFFVMPDVLDQAVSTQNLATIRSCVEKEKAIYEQAQNCSPAHIYGQDNPVPTGEDAWQGLGGSPGVVEGKVFVITDPAQFADFPQGAILVARTTNPAWTPLFYHAAGVITESGGPLSHGAVTARELGIPAVMSIRDACHRLKNGQQVQLDGSRGYIKLLL